MYVFEYFDENDFSKPEDFLDISIGQYFYKRVEYQFGDTKKWIKYT
jgi:hypothetical protein